MSDSVSHKPPSLRDENCFSADAEIIVGLVDRGDPCTNRAECDDGYCNIELDRDGDPEGLDPEYGIAEGRCVRLGEEGHECDDSEFGFCEDGLYCASQQQCVRLPDEGDRCPDFECDDGLDCDFDRDDDRCVAADADDFDFCKG